MWLESKAKGEKLFIGTVGERLAKTFGVKRVYKKLKYHDIIEMLEDFGYVITSDPKVPNAQWIESESKEKS